MIYKNNTVPSALGPVQVWKIEILIEGQNILLSYFQSTINVKIQFEALKFVVNWYQKPALTRKSI